MLPGPGEARVVAAQIDFVAAGEGGVEDGGRIGGAVPGTDEAEIIAAVPRRPGTAGAAGPPMVAPLAPMSMVPSIAIWINQATLCSGRTSSVSTMPPCGGSSSAGGANSVVAMASSSFSSTRIQLVEASGPAQAASAGPPAPTRSRPARRTSHAVNPPANSAPPAAVPAGGASPVPGSWGGVAGGSGGAGAVGRSLPVRASIDTPSPASRPSTVVTR